MKTRLNAMGVFVMGTVILLGVPIHAADSPAFAARPFSMEPDWAHSAEVPILPDGNVHLVPGGVHGFDFGKAYFVVEPTPAKVRIDYGVPLRKAAFEHFPDYHFLDAPGPGYREQRTRIPIKECTPRNNS